MQRYINKIIIVQWCLILSILYIFSNNNNNNNNSNMFVQAIQDSYNPEEEEGGQTSNGQTSKQAN